MLNGLNSSVSINIDTITINVLNAVYRDINQIEKKEITEILFQNIIIHIHSLRIKMIFYSLGMSV